MTHKNTTIMFTAIKNSSTLEFPPLEIAVLYKRQEPKAESFLYLSCENEMNLELL
jgi:ubiquitin carboxyl-terminal hydrolase 34